MECYPILVIVRIALMNIDTYDRDDKYEVPGLNITDRDDTQVILMIWVGDINDGMCTNLVFLFADFAGLCSLGCIFAGLFRSIQQ